MDIICRVIEQGTVQEREFTNQQGQREKFATMPFVLYSGGDTFFAEMVQDQARKQAALSIGNTYYRATLQCTARPWQDQQQQKRWENRLVMTKICEL